MKKVLVTGAQGMLGSTLCNVLVGQGYEVVGTTSAELNLTDSNSIISSINHHMPDIAVNCAAYTNVEKAETEEQDLCFKINAEGAGDLAQICHGLGIELIHISTDYVFGDNSPAGHTEDEDPGDTAQNVYAKSKRAGELAVLRAHPEAYILRVSWSFGPGGKNFVDTMLTLSETRPELMVVDDENGTPSYTKDISNHILYVIENTDTLEPGYYHAVNEGSCSRYEQAIATFELAGKQVTVNRGKLADFPRKAKVCNYSLLKNTKLPKAQSWKEALAEYISSKKEA